MQYQDYYDTLGVPRSASQQDIQRAYRKLARQYHPDINKGKGAEEKFKRINEAYEVLGDPEKRRRYDALGDNWKAGQEFRPPPGFENIRFSFGTRPGQGAWGGFSDFFEALFGGGFADTGSIFSGGFDEGTQRFFEGRGGFAGREETAGEPHHAEIRLSLEDIYRGATKAVSLETVETNGRGEMSRQVKSYQIKIPPGTTAGSTIRLAGQGGRGAGGGKAGDLLLRVNVAPHPRFKLEGYDLICELPISPWEAVLGTKVTVLLIDEQIKLTIPPGSQTGQRLRLKGKGLPVSRSKRGDLYVELKILVPDVPTAAERELFEKLSAVSRFNPRV